MAVGRRSHALRAGLFLLLVLATACFLAADARTSKLLGNTLLLGAATCIVSVPIGACLALAVAKTHMPLRRTATGAIALLLFVPLYVQAASWRAGFGPSGWFTQMVSATPWLTGWTGCVWVHAMAAVPWVALIMSLGLQAQQHELEEQALLDAPAGRVFCLVTVPGMTGPIVVAALWTFIGVAGEMTVTDLFQIRTYSEEIYTEFAVAPALDQPPLRFWPIPVAAGLLALAVLWAGNAFRPDRFDPTYSVARRYRLGAWRVAVCLTVLVVLLLLWGVPVANLVYKSGVIVQQVGEERVRTWSGVKTARIAVMSPVRYWRELKWSLAIGALAASAAAAVAAVLAWFARHGWWGRWTLLAIVAVALALPGPIVGILTIGMLNRPQVPLLVWLYDYTVLAPALVQTIRALPLPTLILWHAFATLPTTIVDHAATEGAGWWTRLVWVGAAARRSAIALAWLAGFVVAIGELPATVLVAPPGLPTLSLRIFNLLHYGVEDQVAGICLALLLIVGLIALALYGMVGAAFRHHLRSSSEVQ